MTQMSVAMDTALAGAVATIFGAVEIVLPSHTIRLLTGAGTISFAGKTFTGNDATYGSIHSVEDLTDGTGDEAPALTLTLVPRSDAAAADLASASMQGSSVSMWLGVVDPKTGFVVGDPLLVFLGLLDVPTIKIGTNSRLLELEITSVFEDFFLSDDGARLSDSFHQYLWPGEQGMSFATGVTHQLYWGAEAPSGVSL